MVGAFYTSVFSLTNSSCSRLVSTHYKKHSAFCDLPAGSPQRIAVACDDGALRIFEAQEGVAGLQYAKTLPRTEGRVLSAAWHPDSSIVVTGTSCGILHVWELASNRELLRITAGVELSFFTCIAADILAGTLMSSL